ncbi:hypothetical protein [Microcystis aeruginosa]|uniref:Uncharacterized protein n=1 Tax=Microcystis aeruginosa Sj TaxID=1979544 RepID=A0A2Z6UXJ6_MICAE|nr:hypothetical protein [Microcystis aeruginosa]MDB9433567.1 hypothetical protein [Microcystis aeruginosa CS-552/01]GBL10588.1 hypothetical protein MSj_02080 [Microcystis aeruginosa Sj]
MVKHRVFNTGSLTLDTEKEHINTGSLTLDTEKEHIEEQIFLSVTPDYQKGPGIQRDGITPPRMQDPHAVGNITLPRLDKIAIPGLDSTTNAYEQRAGTWTLYHHLKEFCDQRGQDWLIIGAQGCGDLTMNPWHLAYLGPNYYIKSLQNQLCGMFLPGDSQEPIDHRIYRCLVKWRDDMATHLGHRYEFLDLKFIMAGGANIIQINDPRVADYDAFLRTLPGYDANLQNIAPFLEFALGGKTIIQQGDVVPLFTAIDRFQDVRHIFCLPYQVPCAGHFRGQVINTINLGEYQLYGDLNARRAALNGPIIVETQLISLGSFLRINLADAAVAKELNKQHFKPVGVSPRRAGEYFPYPGGDTVEIYFPKSIYPFGILGMSGQKIICFASSGLSAKIGNTLEGITLIMSDGFGAEEAMVLDEGCDVFQMINPKKKDDHAFTYTNEELLDRVLAFTHDQMLLDTAESVKYPVNGPALGGDMRQWPLNQNLLNQVENDYGAIPAGLDYTDIFPVSLGRSQIRSILIVAVPKNPQ